MGYVTKEEIECKGCGRIIHKNELQYDSTKGRICLDCYKGKQPRQTTPLKETRRKNPFVTAILNFLWPGLGFIYLGTTRFIIGGIILCILVLIPSVLTWSDPLDPFSIMFSLVFGCFWAFVGLIATDRFNKSMRPPTPVEPPHLTPPLQGKQTRRPVTEEVTRLDRD